MVAPVRVENDQSVKIPKAVIAAAARSDEIHKAAYPSEAPPANGNEPPPPPVETPPAAPPVGATDSAPPPPAVVPPATAEDWKGRYDAMKGRFDQTQGQLQNQAARIASLESMIATMSRPAEPQPPPNKPPASKRIKPEEVEEYGADFVDVVQRAALDIVQPLIDDAVARTKAEFKTDLTKVGTKVAATERETAVNAHQRLLDALDKSMSNWRVINKHPKFLNWLNLTDPLSGVIRRNLLNDAVSQGNAARALSFYKAFIAEEGDPAPAPPPNTPPAPANGAGNGSAGLEKYAAPGRPAASGSTPAAVVPPEKEIITRAQISAFYSRKAQGQYTAQEAADLEAQIFAAQKDGRIR